MLRDGGALHRCEPRSSRYGSVGAALACRSGSRILTRLLVSS